MGDVMPPYLDVGHHAIDPAGIDVGREDVAVRAARQSQFGTDGPPAPTSQHRQPRWMPSASTCRNVTSSKSADSAPNRRSAAAARLSRRYSLMVILGPFLMRTVRASIICMRRVALG